ncbi:polysaccharide biosynthesis tyrosine autokinase [Qipengyuania sp. S6317L1]|uniref:GumC family protein n=1 Tax=Qipengyuania sp. S6317L1 TaxID=2926410 RepID=UPI001FF2B355|nr:polysaccharide biosynthesis tyrosine autokinase [Qipengyuania sp. S6317L1]MCK0098751.1 polysaccharide biosynthesis tyrosine autokinase [Qipengyuania sp. S6317L1]
MNDRSLMQAPGQDPRQGWVDAYMPDGQPVGHFEAPRPLLDLSVIRGMLYRQRWLLAGVIVASLIVGLIVTLLATPMYEARATVKVEPYGQYIVEGQDIEGGIASNQVFDFLQTQIAVIQSRNLATTVVENLNLGERDAILGADFDESRPPNMSDEQWAKTRKEAAAGRLQSSVTAAIPDDNWIISIGYRSSDPALAAELANGYADAFAVSDTANSLETNEYAQEYLLDQITLVRGRLEEAEEATNNYARSAQIIVQPGEEGGAGPTTLTSTNLASANARFSQARAERIAAEQKWRAIQNAPADQLPAVQTNSVLQNLVSDKISKENDLVELRQRYNDEFPQIQNLLQQIAILDRQIEERGNSIKASIRNDYIVARNQEQALQAELNSLTGETLSEQDDQVQLSVLEREAEALRGQLESLLTRYNQVSSAANVDTGAFNKLDSAVVPSTPYAPSLSVNLTMALVAGIALAGGLALLRETFDDRIRSLEEVEDKLGLPLFGQTPYVDERDIEVFGNDFSTLMESYASIRSSIDFSLSRDRNVLQFTSTEASEGKSTTAVILAELFARMGRKTLLIDADLRRPTIAKLLDIEKPKVGLVEVLLGHTELENAVIKGVHENLDILAIAEIPASPTELLSESYLGEMIAKYRNDYSLIIFDSSPVMGLADAPMLSRVVDGTIFVMEANRIQFGKAKAAKRRLQASGAKMLGVILTKYRALEAGQDYSYQYSYYQYGDNKE